MTGSEVPFQDNPGKRTKNRHLISLTVDEMVRISVAFAKSQTFKNKGSSMTAEQIFVVVLAGQELGIGPSQAIMGIKMIEGKPEMSANLMAGLVKSSDKYDYTVAYGDGSSDEEMWCEVAFWSKGTGESVGVSRFSKADAVVAGLWRNNYLKFWRNMLFARALSNGTKWFVPDALMVSAYHDGEIEGDTEAAVPELAGPPQGEIAAEAETTRADPHEETQVSADEVELEPDREPVPVVAEPEPYRRTDEPELDYDPVTPVEPFEPDAEPPPPVVTFAPNGPTISPAQQRLLYARFRELGLDSEDAWRPIVNAICGTPHVDRVPKGSMNDLLAHLTELEGPNGADA